MWIFYFSQGLLSFFVSTGPAERTEKPQLTFHLQLWQLFLINQDIRAKLKNNPKELQRWEQTVMNELRKSLCADVWPP